MSALDIIIAVLLLWAVYKGFTDGVIVQLGGIVGLLLGVYLAFRFSAKVGDWLCSDDSFAQPVGFIVIVVVVLILIALLGRLLRGLFRIAGLGMLDRMGGLLLGVVKMSLIIGILLTGFRALNEKEEWVSRKTLSESILYEPMLSVASFTFPYLDLVKEKLLSADPASEKAEPETTRQTE